MSEKIDEKAAKTGDSSAKTSRNPFASRTSNAKVGSSSLPGRPTSSGSSQRSSSSSSRFGTFASRFGAQQRLDWRIAPLAGGLVRFDLNGLGDPFHRILSTPMNLDYGDLQNAMNALHAGHVPVDGLVDKLDTIWADYALKGAMLIFEWQEQSPRLFVSPTPAASQSETFDDEDEQDDKPEPPEDLSINNALQLTCYRALDPGLVMNVLARTRSQILLPDTPLALEVAFLERALVTDDSQLLALARATGSIQESW